MTACDDCLRRTDLIAAIAGRLQIEFKQRTAPGRVLALGDEELLAVGASDVVGRGTRGSTRPPPVRARRRSGSRRSAAATTRTRSASGISPTRRRSSTCSGTPARSPTATVWPWSAPGVRPRTGSRSPARSGAACLRRR